MSFYVSTATFFLLHCDEWDRVVALPETQVCHRSYIIAASYWEVGRSLEAKPVQGAFKLDIYLDNSAKNTFLQR